MKSWGKMLITISLIIIVIVGIFFLNKKEVPKSNGMFAIMLEEEKGTGKYEHAKDNKWPQSEEYVINMYKTYCEKGSVLRWNNETKRMNATVKGTDRCYVYFDLSEYGSEEHPYLIQTIEDLVRLSNEVNSGTAYTGKYFLLTNDLDFQDASDYEDASRTDFGDINEINGDEALITELTTGSGFKPIGFKYFEEDVNNFFEGNFDGNNHKISNLYEKKPNKFSSDFFADLGLFGKIKDSKISNLTITGEIEIEDRGMVDGVQILNRAQAGGIVGVAKGNTYLYNLINYVNVTSFTGRDSVAGILANVATDSNVEIKNCKNYGNITNSNHTGGIFGRAENNSEVLIQNCENYGIVLNEKGNTGAGGIVAYTDSNGLVTIKDSNNYGVISSGKSITNELKIGGIIGNIHNASIIENCNNYGDIIGEFNPDNPNFLFNGGGIVGRQTGVESTIKNCHNYGNITGVYRIGGIIGHTNTSGIITIVNSSNHGDIKNNDGTNPSNNGFGGIIGYKSPGMVYILNSYNEGNITASKYSASGLVGNDSTSTINEIEIINSYNVGNVTGKNGHANGIIGIEVGGNAHIKLNNVYSIGVLNGTTGNYGVGYINATYSQMVNNVYYNSAYEASNQEYGWMGKTIDNMKSQAFVDELNQNAENIDMTNYSEKLQEYEVSKWTLGPAGYPTLVNE